MAKMRYHEDGCGDLREVVASSSAINGEIFDRESEALHARAFNTDVN